MSDGTSDVAPKCRSGSVHRLRRPTSPPPPAQPPASQHATLISLTALAPRSFSLRSTGCRLHCTWKETWRLLATALPPNSAGSAIVADQGHEVCDGRRLFPLLPSPPTPLRRSSLAAAAKRPVAVSVGDVLGPILSKASASIAHRREARHWRASRRRRLCVSLV